MTQMNLFDELPERPAKQNGAPSLDRFEGALLCSTVGDALGWPTEFLKPTNGHRPQFRLPVKDFVSWEKMPIGNATSISNATLIIELPERTGRLCGIYQ